MRAIFHIDANSAYLSWTAVNMLEHGHAVDIREIPSVIAGDQQNRHGIILAKSIPAKRYDIRTGNSLMEARRKCPGLQIYPPDYDLYMNCSDAMYDLLSEYSPSVERYSIDECYVDYTKSMQLFGSPEEVAFMMKERIKRELGFTVNVGISHNKLLAKMAGELKKPDAVCTLYPDEIPEKLWPLPVEELFMIGRATMLKLRRVNLNTIGDVARSDINLLKALLKNFRGNMVWHFANGIDAGVVGDGAAYAQKGIGNGQTIAYDVLTAEEAAPLLLALSERAAMRLRRQRFRATVITVSVRSSDLDTHYGHQRKLCHSVCSTPDIYRTALSLFNEMWRGEPIRKINIRLSGLESDERQLSIFETEDAYRQERLDETVDKIRQRYGQYAVFRGIFANTCHKPVLGSTNDGNFIIMGGYMQS